MCVLTGIFWSPRNGDIMNWWCTALWLTLSLLSISLSLSLSFLNQNYLPCFFFIPSLYISHYFFNCWKKTKSFWADHAKSHQKLFSRSPRGESIFDEHILSCGTI
jgi:hypothetical protein